METTKTDDMRALLVIATFGDTSARFKAKRELIEALKYSLGMQHWRAKQIVIQWISDHRREHAQSSREPTASPRTLEGTQESKRPHVTVEWR